MGSTVASQIINTADTSCIESGIYLQRQIKLWSHGKNRMMAGAQLLISQL